MMGGESHARMWICGIMLRMMDTCDWTATAGKRERTMRIKELFALGTSYTAWGGNRTKGVSRRVFTSRLLISYLQCVGGQSPLLFLIYITHRVLKVAVRFPRCQRSTMLSHNRI
jgi:hypothetical protein